MQIIIHAGMNKTGSTSIQRTFAALADKQEQYTYAPADEAHHNYLFNLVFRDLDAVLARHPHFRALGAPRADLERKGADYRRRLDTALRGNARPVFLFSSEAVRGGVNAVALARLHAYCRGFTDDIQVIAYVRPPVAYMQSALQQHLRNRLNSADLPLLFWPDYRLRFKTLLQTFGAERVRLKRYNRACFKGGDVALDFAAEIGVPLLPEQVISGNESIGLEAAACVHAFKSQLPPRRGAAWQADKQLRFAEALRPLSTGKLRFTRKAVAPMLAREADDLRWMEAQLGEPLADFSNGAAGAHQGVAEIGSLADLLAIADDQTAAVEALAGVTAPAGSSKRRRLLYALTALYDQPGKD